MPSPKTSPPNSTRPSARWWTAFPGRTRAALALYCFLRHPDDYKKTVLRGANTNGDSDSIACIAGGISGARLGAAAIPKEWFMRIEKADQLAVAAERLRLKKRGAAVS